jgi:hypothetical protein
VLIKGFAHYQPRAIHVYWQWRIQNPLELVCWPSYREKMDLSNSLALLNYEIFIDIIKAAIHSVSKMFSSWNCMGVKKITRGQGSAYRYISVTLWWGHTFCNPVRSSEFSIVENVPRTVNVTNKGRRVIEDVWEYLNKGWQAARENCTVLSSTIWNMYNVQPATLCGGM